MPTTLKDIAKEVGVSVMTVSTALRYESHPRVSAETRQKVLDVAWRLHYRHNLHARSLRLGRSELIGLLAFDLQVKVALLKLEAVDRAIWRKGYRTLVQNAAGHGEMEQQFIMDQRCAPAAG